MSTQTPDQGTTQRCPRWLRLLLIVSLALNLMVVGLVAGMAWTGGGKHGGHHPSRLEKIGGPLTRALSKEDRRAIGREMRSAYQDRAGDRGAQHELMQALIDDLRQVPFDRDAVTRQLAAQRDILQDRVQLGQTLLVDRLADMSEQDRAAYADRLQNALDRRRNR